MNDPLYEQYVSSIMNTWLPIHLGPSLRQIIDALYDAGYIIDKLVTATSGIDVTDWHVYKSVTGYCSDALDCKYKFTSSMHRDASQYHRDIWLLDDEIDMIPISGY